MLKKYSFYFKGIRYEKIKDDYINITYIVFEDRKYIIQKVNLNYYKNISRIINSLVTISSYFLNENSDIIIPNLIANKEGSFITNVNESYYICYDYLEFSNNFDYPKTEAIAFQAGVIISLINKELNKALEKNKESGFLNLSNFVYNLTEYDELLLLIKENKYFRKKFCLVECNVLIKHYNYVKMKLDLIEANNLPKRLIYNNPTFDNILFDEHEKAIGLFNIMNITKDYLIWEYAYGVCSLLYYNCENERHYYNIKIKYNYFEAFTFGFIKNTIEYATIEELNLLIDGLVVLIYIKALRYIKDFLNNDTVYHTNYCNHNLIRGRNYLSLFQEVQNNYNKLKKIVSKVMFKCDL